MRENLIYYFVPNQTNISIYKLSDFSLVTMMEFDRPEEEFKSDYELFKTLPEYTLCQFIFGILAPCNTSESLAKNYNDLLIASNIYRTWDKLIDKENPSTSELELAEKKALNAINWLTNSTDFYFAPASSRYHDAKESGLVIHSINTANALRYMNLSMFNVSISNMIFLSLVHDWSKVNRYSTYTKNVKDANGNWITELGYKIADDVMLTLGDGVGSMFLVNKFFPLSTKEAGAIRWHCGRWSVADGEISELHNEFSNNPMLMILHTADMLATTKYA